MKIENFKPWLRTNTTLAETSMALYVRTIKRFLNEFPGEIKVDNINAFISRSARQKQSFYCRYVFKYYLRFLRKKRLYEEVVGIPSRPRKKIAKYYPDQIIKSFISRIGHDLFKTWATLQYATAARAFEIIGLEEESIDLDYGQNVIRVMIKGKRGKTRYTFISDKLRPVLERHLRGRAGFLFLPEELNGAAEEDIKRAINSWRDRYYFGIQKAALESNVSPFGTHDFRRNALELMRQSGADIRTIQKVAGHSSINTTAGYFDENPEDAKRAILAHQLR